MLISLPVIVLDIENVLFQNDVVLSFIHFFLHNDNMDCKGIKEMKNKSHVGHLIS